MIQNLNQISFKSFGTVGSERASGSAAPAKPEQRLELHLGQGSVPVYRAVSEVWFSYGTGLAILSVSQDGESFQHFYLDKYVQIKPGIFFCLSAFLQNDAVAEYSAKLPPELTGMRQQIQNFQLQRRMCVTNLYTFFYHEKEKGFFFPGESHPMLELTYVDQGSLHSVVEGRDLLLKQGDLVIYGPDQWHMQYADIDVAPHYITISFDVESNDISRLINRKFRIPQKGTALLQQLLREQETSDEYTADTIVSLLNMLLLTILRHADAPEEKLKNSNAIHSENEIIRKAQQYISTHIREKLSVPTVARMVDVSPSYLTALFHKNLQISPGEYIRRIKLQESKIMIRDDNLNFTEIAAALQYSTVHHFSRQFKEKFGITPTEYARSVR